MKKVTASEARKRWFRLLDEVIEGQPVVIERRGHGVVVRREETGSAGRTPSTASYRRLLRAPHADAADRWSWEWRGRKALRSVSRSAR